MQATSSFTKKSLPVLLTFFVCLSCQLRGTMAVSSPPPPSPSPPPPPPGEVPGRPFAAYISEEGDQFLSLTFNRPLSEGTSPITSYRVCAQQILYGSCTLYDFTSTNTTIGFFGRRTVTIGPLANGVRKRLRVAAVSDEGQGSYSFPGVWGRPRTIPSEPLDFVSNPGNGEIRYSWRAPLYDGGANIAYWVIRFGVAPTFDQALRIDVGDPGLIRSNGRIFFTLSGLTNGFEIVANVAAENEAGEGPPSNIAFALPLGVPPSPPLDLRASGQDASVLLSWLPPLDNGGYEIGGYDVIVFANGVPLRTLRVTPPAAETTGGEQRITFLVPELVNFQQYGFEVLSFNIAGPSLPSSPRVTATPTNVRRPSPPFDIRAYAGNGFIQLLWRPPVDDGNSPVLEYNINIENVGNGERRNTRVSLIDGSGDVKVEADGQQSTLITNLANEETVRIRMRAINVIGQSNIGTPVVEVTPTAQSLLPPTFLSVLYPTNTTVWLTWQAPIGAEGNETYFVSFSSTGEEEILGSQALSDYIFDSTTGAVFAEVVNLNASTSYSFKVNSDNNNDDGSPIFSNIVVGTTSSPLLCTPLAENDINNNEQIFLNAASPATLPGYALPGLPIFTQGFNGASNGAVSLSSSSSSFEGISGATSVTWNTSVVVANSAQEEGENFLLDVLNPGNDSFSIMLRARLDFLSAPSSGNGDVVSIDLVRKGLNEDAPSGYSIALSSDGTVTFTVGDKNGVMAAATIESSSLFNTWHHYALTIRAGGEGEGFTEVLGYVDGSAAALQPGSDFTISNLLAPDADINPLAPLTLPSFQSGGEGGENDGDTSPTYQIAAQDVAVFRYALDPSFISGLVSAPNGVCSLFFPPPEPVEEEDPCACTSLGCFNAFDSSTNEIGSFCFVENPQQCERGVVNGGPAGESQEFIPCPPQDSN